MCIVVYHWLWIRLFDRRSLELWDSVRTRRSIKLNPCNVSLGGFFEQSRVRGRVLRHHDFEGIEIWCSGIRVTIDYGYAHGWKNKRLRMLV